MRPILAGRDAELVQIGSPVSAERPGPPAEMIFGEWYPAARAGGLRPREATITTLLGIPMLGGRKSDGTLFALRDLCPHRGIPLSAGWFDGETVMCKYHGWRFEPCSGRCEEIPSLTSHDGLEPTRIFANAFPVRERDGYAWVYVPAAGAGRVVDEAVLLNMTRQMGGVLVDPLKTTIVQDYRCMTTWVLRKTRGQSASSGA